MSRLVVAPIVEGHGEVAALRVLLSRIWQELLGGEYLEVLRPIREKRSRLATDQGRSLSKAVELAANKLTASASAANDPTLILILLDADDDLPCILGPRLLAIAQSARADYDIACVVANVEYETWFVAAADSLPEAIDLREGERPPNNPEALRYGKGWVKQRFLGGYYSETVDQPKLTARFDLATCRSRSPSFDKLCRDLEARLKPRA